MTDHLWQPSRYPCRHESTCLIAFLTFGANALSNNIKIQNLIRTT